MRTPPEASQAMHEPRKPNNLRTALILGAVALACFLAVVAKRVWLMP